MPVARNVWLPIFVPCWPPRRGVGSSHKRWPGVGSCRELPRRPAVGLGTAGPWDRAPGRRREARFEVMMAGQAAVMVAGRMRVRRESSYAAFSIIRGACEICTIAASARQAMVRLGT
jgi:hypothetical protein